MFRTLRTALAAALLAAPLAPLTASAMEPPSDVATGTAAHYNDFIVGCQTTIGASIGLWAEAVGTGDAVAINTAQQELIRVIDEQSALVAALPPFLGDSSLRDGQLELFAFYREAATVDFEAVEVAVRAGDDAKLQAALDGIGPREAIADARFGAIQDAFADKFGIILGDGSGTPEIVEDEPDPHQPSIRLGGSYDFAGGRRGFSLGYRARVQNRSAAGFGWTRQSFDGTRTDRVELTMAYDLLDLGPIDLQPTLGLGYAWGEAGKGVGAVPGVELAVTVLDPLVIYSGVSHPFYAGGPQELIGGWQVQTGAAVAF